MLFGCFFSLDAVQPGNDGQAAGADLSLFHQRKWCCSNEMTLFVLLCAFFARFSVGMPITDKLGLGQPSENPCVVSASGSDSLQGPV